MYNGSSTPTPKMIQAVTSFYKKRSLLPENVDVCITPEYKWHTSGNIRIHSALPFPVDVDCHWGDITISEENLKSLKMRGMPKIIKGDLNIETDVLDSFHGSPEEVRSLNFTSILGENDTRRGTHLRQPWNYPNIHDLSGLPKIINENLLIQSHGTALHNIDILFETRIGGHVDIRVPNLISNAQKTELELFLKMRSHLD
jgi:hypothetical protein